MTTSKTLSTCLSMTLSDIGASGVQPMTSTDMENATTLGWRRILVERRRPPSIAARSNAYWLVLVTVCIGAFMNQLDASIVTVAFPTLQRTFHAGLGAVTWVGLSYL